MTAEQYAQAFADVVTWNTDNQARGIVALTGANETEFTFVFLCLTAKSLYSGKATADELVTAFDFVRDRSEVSPSTERPQGTASFGDEVSNSLEADEEMDAVPLTDEEKASATTTLRGIAKDLDTIQGIEAQSLTCDGPVSDEFLAAHSISEVPEGTAGFLFSASASDILDGRPVKFAVAFGNGVLRRANIRLISAKLSEAFTSAMRDMVTTDAQQAFARIISKALEPLNNFTGFKLLEVFDTRLHADPGGTVDILACIPVEVYTAEEVLTQHFVLSLRKIPYMDIEATLPDVVADAITAMGDEAGVMAYIQANLVPEKS